MKATFYTLVCLLFLSFSLRVSAQVPPDTARLAFGFDAGYPLAALSGRYTFSLGGSLRFDYPISRRAYITASVGYNNFLLDDGALTTQQAILNVPVPTMQTMPFKVGYKYYLIRKFYVQAEVGETLLLDKTTMFAPKSYAFTYSPQFGFLVKLKHPNNYIDAGIRYEGVSSFYYDSDKYNFWAVHISYSFNL